MALLNPNNPFSTFIIVGWNLPADGGSDSLRMAMECTVEILIFWERDFSSRALWRFCIAGNN